MAELNVSKQSIIEALGKNVKYTIPEYQRPYSWGEDECAKLWEDIVAFFEKNHDNGEEYYLGTLVFCKDQKAEGKKIIDGQQRITSFMLLLRAFYKRLEEAPPYNNLDGLKRDIESCVWEIGAKSGIVEDKSKIRITSTVITANDNEMLHSIVESGESGDGESNYQINYQFFYDKCEEYAKNNPTGWEDLCLFILRRCILFPIECRDDKTALTIFSTLNDRGKPLSDTDIFKAEIYNSQEDEAAKQRFVEDWKKLEGDTEDLGIEMDSIFRYYSHFIRGREGITKKEIALRDFYREKPHERLKELELMSNLHGLVEFWREILSRTSGRYIGAKSRNFVHCLCKYPNEYWRYPISVFFLAYKGDKNSDEFKRKLEAYLTKVTAFFYAKFIIKPTVNSIKDDVYHACRSICEGKEEGLYIKGYSVDDMRKQMHQHIAPKAERGLLLLKAYLHKEQFRLIPEDFQIEHIFPREWYAAHHHWEEKEAKEYTDNIGNKIVIERKLNLKASNTFFSEKKKSYQASNIEELKQLSQHPSDIWFKEDIDKRKNEIIGALLSFFIDAGVVS